MHIKMFRLYPYREYKKGNDKVLFLCVNVSLVVLEKTGNKGTGGFSIGLSCCFAFLN